MCDKTNEPRGRSPSPLNGERGGVRGESAENALIPRARCGLVPLTSPYPLPSLRERRGNEGRPPVVYPAVQAVNTVNAAALPPG